MSTSGALGLAFKLTLDINNDYHDLQRQTEQLQEQAYQKTLQKLWEASRAMAQAHWDYAYELIRGNRSSIAEIREKK